jgi:hypothetical protein
MMVERRRKIHVLGQAPKPVIKPESGSPGGPAGYSRCPFCGFPQRPNTPSVDFWKEGGVFHCWNCNMAWGRLVSEKIGNMVLPTDQEYGPSQLRAYAKYFTDQRAKKMETKFEKPKFPGPWVVKE